VNGNLAHQVIEGLNADMIMVKGEHPTCEWPSKSAGCSRVTAKTGIPV